MNCGVSVYVIRKNTARESSLESASSWGFLREPSIDTTASSAGASLARTQPHSTQAGESQGWQPGSAECPDQQAHPQSADMCKAKPGSQPTGQVQWRWPGSEPVQWSPWRAKMSSHRSEKARCFARHSYTLARDQQPSTPSQARPKGPRLSLNTGPGPKCRRKCGEAPGQPGLSD